MKKYDELAKRMKEYEEVNRHYLTRRTPAILRLDGKAFHTFTKGFQKPFDYVFMISMQDTMKELCEQIQGCVLGYTQSDEITLVLIDYKKLNSSSWFDYNVQKCVSIAASMATLIFNRAFYKNFSSNKKDSNELYQIYCRASEKGAMFDARIFSIPKEEVTNCILWRQNDAIRNSIESFGQANFSHKELYKKSCEDIKTMLMEQKGIDWNELPLLFQRGSCCIKKEIDGKHKWIIDNEIPIFKKEGRTYIDDLIFIGEES